MQPEEQEIVKVLINQIKESPSAENVDIYDKFLISIQRRISIEKTLGTYVDKRIASKE